LDSEINPSSHNEVKANFLKISDCGANNSFIYPGESLHQELFHLVKAGLTPKEALKTSIINGPKFLEKQKVYGNIKKRKNK